MTNTMTLANTLINLRQSIEQERTDFNLLRASKQITRFKQELDRSFSEFDDIQETLATYNLYRQLETLQQQINIREE